MYSDQMTTFCQPVPDLEVNLAVPCGRLKTLTSDEQQLCHLPAPSCSLAEQQDLGSLCCEIVQQHVQG